MNKTLELFVLAAFLLAGCETQDTTLLLYETQVTPGLTALPNANYTSSVSIGPPGKTVPVQVTWSAGQDDEGCLKVVELKVERTGGDPSSIISNVQQTTLPGCVMKWESSDTTRFQMATVSLKYETIKGVKKYSFSGPIASVQGNGEFKANSSLNFP